MCIEVRKSVSRVEGDFQRIFVDNHSEFHYNETQFSIRSSFSPKCKFDDKI